MTNRVLLLISFVSLTGLPTPLVEKAYEVTPSKDTGEFRSYHYGLPVSVVSQRAVNPVQVFGLMDATAKMDKDDFESVMRALHWYQESVVSEDGINRFTSLWVGLENLNGLLIRHFNITERPQPCPKCHQTSTTQLLGIKRLIEEGDFGNDVWKKARETGYGLSTGPQSLHHIHPS